MVNDTLGLLLDKLVVTFGGGGEGGGFDFGSVFPVTSVCYFLDGGRRRRKIRILLLFSFSNSRSRIKARGEFREFRRKFYDVNWNIYK